MTNLEFVENIIELKNDEEFTVKDIADNFDMTSKVLGFKLKKLSNTKFNKKITNETVYVIDTIGKDANSNCFRYKVSYFTISILKSLKN